MNEFENRIVIAGSGVSGIRAAFDLAETGNRVILIDKAPGHGGLLPRLDHQFPDNHCGMCRMLPMVERDPGKQFCLKKGVIHKNIEIMQACEITDVKGSPGNLSVSLNQKAAGIDKDLCINCGKCEDVCPVTAADSFNEHLSKRKAVYFPVPFQIPNKKIIDQNHCTRCKECLKVCETGAIDLTFKDRNITLKGIQSVIIATGSRIYNPEKTDLYGFGKIKNVVTSTAFERLISQSGPSEGNLKNTLGKEEIINIAWIQCVGSRNIMTGSDYCSSVCCMFSIKEALLAKEKIGKECETTIFYMDMRTYGRDFQRYRERAENEYKVKFVRCRIHSVEQDTETCDPKITYIDDTGNQKEKVFDLVVLAAGKAPEQALPQFTDNRGVFVINSENEFRDISESVIEASSSVSKTGLSTPVPAPDKTAVSKKSPSFLVAVCRGCSLTEKNIDAGILIDRINTLPGMMTALPFETACSANGFNKLIEKASDPVFNRLIILSCSPDIFMVKSDEITRKSNIAENGMDFVHYSLQDDEKSLLSKIIASQGLLKTRNNRPYRSRQVFRHCMIAGSGPSGLAAAKTLSRYHIPVTLIETEEEPGGNLKFIKGKPEKSRVKKLLSYMNEKSDITIMTQSEITSCKGTPGAFTLSVKNREGFTVIPAGAVILASGGEKRKTESYGCDNSVIMTLFDLEQVMEETDFKNRHLVMIQCVDSREEPNNYCSRICCIKALKTAVRIKEREPDVKITIIYRDIMTYGEYEKIYTEARRKAIRFIPYPRERKPEVKKRGKGAKVSVYDPVLQEKIDIDADIVSLSTGVKPYENRGLADIFNLDKTADGFIREADYKWRPTDTGREGIFVCGLARRPLNADEAVKEGCAAAMRAVRILSREVLTPQLVTAVVRHTLCSRCQACIDSCPYHARFSDPESGKIIVDDTSCQACGTCASVCPNSATVVSGFEDGGVMNQIESMM